MMVGPCIDHGLCGDASGYGQRLTNGKHALVHRLAYADANGFDEATMGGVVMHACDNPRCVNPLHLSLGTHKLNAQDRENKGRRKSLVGELHQNSKLTSMDVKTIRARYVPRCKINGSNALAREFGVAQSQVSRITRGEQWA